MALFLAAILLSDYRLQPLAEAPPTEVPEAVRKGLADKGVRVLGEDGKPFADVWLRVALPTVEPKQELNIKYTMIRQGSVLGLVRFHAGSSDFKNQKFPAGVYTMRYMVQPEDGDHVGVSESRDFVLLCPAASEKGLDPMAVEEAVKLSAKIGGKKHPSVLWLAAAGAEKAPHLSNDETHQRWMLEVEIPQASGQGLRVSITVVGKSPDF